MKHHTLFNNIVAAVGAAAAMIAVGCAGRPKGASDNDGAQYVGMKIEGEYIESQARYGGFNGLDSCVLTIRTNVEWPLLIGDADIKPLQAALLEAAFNARGSRGIKAVVDSFISETDSYDLGIVKGSVALPEGVDPVYGYFRAVDVRRGEMTSKTVTYEIVDMTYLGGAHPNTYTRAITYAFEQHGVLSNDNLFSADRMPIVYSALNEAAAAQYGVARGELTEAGFFEDAVSVPSSVSIDNGAILFHFNRYDVAPYSMGAVNIRVSPESVRDALSPLGSLLLED